ncbi:phBC6A51 family helix-turn-helix protein [Weizmannia sp. CD-2023]|uniref:phBC6A51 family helix-turn-helix protein n=1 Tax=Heyndrickxia TaxID=2837504 RepID=UPI002E250474|nr:phBC6A51 family helix-turn-helix protein [Weizmannia sp. CD-2023]MED4899729.1 phBC6A51 family helix-turn-helix protein [Weizmannia sp. CD-2023]
MNEVSHKKSTKSLTLNQIDCAKILAANDIHQLTMKEIADMLGVSERTIYRWKQDPAFIAYQNEQADQLMEDFIAEAYVELRKIVRSSQSEKSKLKAIEMVLSNRGKLKQTQEVTHKVEHEFDLEKERKEVLEMDVDSIE